MTAGGPRPAPWLRVRGAVVDRLVALVLAPLLAPVVAVLGWRIRRADGGPALVGLERVGRDGERFTMWKLRSMRADGPSGAASGEAITAVGDDRITPLGATMRRWRLDELPQVWNVLRGDMALLGPRPETPSMVDLGQLGWRRALAARPGIAGPTQLCVERWEAEVLVGGSAPERYRDQVLPVKLAIDAWYVERATPLTDLQVAWSMVERFALDRDPTLVQRTVARWVPEARRVGEAEGDAR